MIPNPVKHESMSEAGELDYIPGNVSMKPKGQSDVRKRTWTQECGKTLEAENVREHILPWRQE